MTGMKITFALIGTAIIGLLGGWDGILLALLTLIAIDYLTGFIGAITQKKLNSNIGFTGILRKVAILLVVALAVCMDSVLNLGEPWIRTAVCWFYIANEGISIMENATVIGIPVPDFIKNVLQQVKDRADDKAKAGASV